MIHSKSSSTRNIEKQLNKNLRNTQKRLSRRNNKIKQLEMELRDLKSELYILREWRKIP
jgi:hypothetical protein